MAPLAPPPTVYIISERSVLVHIIWLSLPPAFSVIVDEGQTSIKSRISSAGLHGATPGPNVTASRIIFAVVGVSGVPLIE